MYDVWYEAPMVLNFLYAIIGVIIGVILAMVTYRIFSKVTHFDIASELEKGNLAVGIVVCGIFIMIGLIVGVIICIATSERQFAQPALSISDSAEIMLLTIYPGNELYSTFGHSAIRVLDKSQRMDRIYNYGTFSFAEPGFYLKFTRGQLDYILSAYPYKYAHQMYVDEKRPIIAQVLNLSPEMKQVVFKFLEWNYLPENRRYRYDFFFDNCATRIRDIFENTLKDSIHLYYNNEREFTFRNYIDIYLVNHPFSDYGIDLSLGEETDRIATGREALFLPDYLFESFAGSSIRHNGIMEPLVARTDTLLWFDGAKNPPVATAFPWAGIIIWTIFLLALFVTWQEFQDKQQMAKWLDRFLFSLAGFIGLLVVFLWFFTDHKVTPDNWNLAWAWPTHLIFLIPSILKKIPKHYFAAYTGMVLVVLLGWGFLPQSLHTATIPMLLSLGLRSGMHFYNSQKA